MQKQSSPLKLPRIDDFSSQKSKTAFSSPLNASNIDQSIYHPASGIISVDHNSTKINKTLLAQIDTETDNEIGLKKSEKGRSLGDSREARALLDSTMKQNWILKKMEAQRDSLEVKQGTKASHLSHVLSSIPNQSAKNAANIRKRLPFEENSAGSKSVNTGMLKPTSSKHALQLEKKDTYKRKPSDPLAEFTEEMLRTAQKSILQQSSINRSDKIKFPMLNPEPAASSLNPEQEDKKVNMELILQIDEKIKAIFEGRTDRTRVIELVKGYIELFNAEEAIQVDAFFIDARMRKNTKTYLMLEKSSIFALLSFVNEESLTRDSNQTHMNNICNYLYSNFLNFVEVVVNRLELIPRSSVSENLEKMKQIGKRRVKEIDRSFGLEQINKLLLKVLRSHFKNIYKKGDRCLKLELLLEKVEFGLMPNHFDELKNIFNDLIFKFNINVPTRSAPSSPESPADSKKPNKSERQNPLAKGKGLTDAARKAGGSEVEAFLPPLVPKPEREGKHAYTLVLDMDETLIHFEEVGGRGRFFVRPHAEDFLREMSEHFELVIFTAGMQDYADAVLNILDPNGYISHRLYRHHVSVNTSFPGIIKDLSKIGRDLTKTILVDNAPENFRMQLDNGIEILSWYNDPYDSELLTLKSFLRDLVVNQVEDVRPAVRLLRENLRHKRR